MKSEVRNPKPERRPKPEIRINANRYSFRNSTFGFCPTGRCSDFGHRISAFLLVALSIFPGAVFAQQRPYIGFAYPAGGQRGTTFQVRLGGQNIDDAASVIVTGSGVTARIAENYRRLNNPELALINEQAHRLRTNTLSDSQKAAMLSDFATMPASADEN